MKPQMIDQMAAAAFNDRNHARKSYDELTEDCKEIWRSKMRAAIAVFLREPPAVTWECFCDEAYFHNWAVRPVGENRWGFCFHLPTQQEAEGLCGLLNNDD